MQVNYDSTIEKRTSDNYQSIIDIGPSSNSDSMIELCPTFRMTLTLKKQPYVPGTGRFLAIRSKPNIYLWKRNINYQNVLWVEGVMLF